MRTAGDPHYVLPLVRRALQEEQPNLPIVRIAASILVAVSALATFVPAARAASIEPRVALRAD